MSVSTSPDTEGIERSETESELVEFLTSHPKMLGVLFTMGLLILEATGEAAAGATCVAGP